MSTEKIKKAWDSTKGVKSGDQPEYDKVSGDFRARLNSVYGDLVVSGNSSGIAGLEEFEEEVRKVAKTEPQPSAQAASAQAAAALAAPALGAPSVRDGAAILAAREAAEQTARAQPKGTGAQKGEAEPDTPEKARKDAAGSQQRVEADAVHSPAFPSAARPLGAESPVNTQETAKAATKAAKGTAKTGAAKKTATKTTAKKAVKK